MRGPRSMAPCVARDRWHRAWPLRWLCGCARDGYCKSIAFTTNTCCRPVPDPIVVLSHVCRSPAAHGVAALPSRCRPRRGIERERGRGREREREREQENKRTSEPDNQREKLGERQSSTKETRDRALPFPVRRRSLSRPPPPSVTLCPCVHEYSMSLVVDRRVVSLHLSSTHWEVNAAGQRK